MLDACVPRMTLVKRHDNPIWVAAIHEAAHAVVGVAMGRELISVELPSSGPGVTRFADGSIDEELIIKIVATAMAGTIAERFLEPPRLTPREDRGMRYAPDDEIAGDAALALSRDPLTAKIRALSRAVRHVVVHWRSIEQVAELLVRDGELAAAEVGRAVKEIRGS